jgi:hypothetical protein
MQTGVAGRNLFASGYTMPTTTSTSQQVHTILVTNLALILKQFTKYNYISSLFHASSINCWSILGKYLKLNRLVRLILSSLPRGWQLESCAIPHEAPEAARATCAYVPAY